MSNEIIECIIIVVKEYFENMEMEMKSEILLGLTNMMNEILIKSINKCGVMYNFNSEEAMRMLFLDVKVAESKSKSKSKPVKESKKVVPMPYDGKMKDNCCKALVLNHGLYSQCSTSVEDVRYCKKCGDDPEYGTIEERLRMDCMEFRDKKGKSPTHYSKVMKKLKISREEVLEEAGKLNIIIDDFHFEEEKKEKGRPKKPKRKVELADDSTDLFAALVAKANESESEYSSDESSIIAESVIESVLDKVSVITENNEKKAAKESEKQAQRQAEKDKKEEEKQAQRQAEKDKKEEEKQAQRQAEKEKKEAEKQAEKEKKEAEKQAQKAEKDKKEAEKQAQKAAKDAEKAAKDAEKAAKEAQKQAEKEKKESEKVSGKKSQKSKKDSSSEVEKKEVEEDDEEDVVKRFEFEGVKYLKSKKTGVIYNMDQELIGKWNEKTNKIDFNIQDSEEEEEEYDE